MHSRVLVSIFCISSFVVVVSLNQPDMKELSRECLKRRNLAHEQKDFTLPGYCMSFRCFITTTRSEARARVITTPCRHTEPGSSCKPISPYFPEEEFPACCPKMECPASIGRKQLPLDETQYTTAVQGGKKAPTWIIVHNRTKD